VIDWNFNSVSGVAKHRVARIKLCKIALFGMVLSGTMGFHPVIKQLFSMIIWQVYYL
jgi:hypothetical protein